MPALELFVEAKEVGKKLPGYDEQLGDYFAKAPEFMGMHKLCAASRSNTVDVM